ncbi:MAG: LysM peptidoglycan-binding domain-containing protein [Winogradskyella sp.]|uniref:LysM peptidoglycan-binding domain-containing protein n=1 Tax=Winogradskyella sp. TaxID=1883156 RepID=UPI0017A34AC6|nr:LysM peptidoglycan-binding domain-containing protein [Winogradskyella sp.]MBT8245083.1 LysM peptidoglycan-binding domain-containing protein [Winogradskyella sp.]NNK22447.1 LysM peptidoglycan-binding domain-containing protein [Winogradskyella sp.]
MKIFLTILIFVCSFYAQAQEYKTHKVKSGETLESIAKQYLVTPFDILALNPDAKDDFGVNTTLIIPVSKVKNEPIIEESKEIIDYKKHKVRRKETLYGLSKSYNVTEAEIKKANPRLYSENLRRGDRIRIPRYKTVVSKQTFSNTIKKYAVRPKEGKWRIAYKFGITVSELEALNPDIKEVLQPGDVLNVPNIADNEEKQTDTASNYYEVQPKEGFFRLKKKLDLTKEELEALNPELKESGLKAGMVLKLPAGIEILTDSIIGDFNVTDLRDNIINTSTKRLAILMPFRLQRIDLDSVAEAKDIIKSDRILSTALDFHSGVLMALDSAKQLGISSNLKVFDTENRTSEISNITNKEDFSDYDAIIGPMMSKNFDRFVSEVRGNSVPVFAPLAKPSKVTTNVYQTIPDKKILEQKMVDFVKQDSTKNQVVIISDQKHRGVNNNLKRHFPEAKQLFSEITKEGKDKGKDAYFIYPVTFENLFKKGKNIVFLETDDVSFGSSIISLLNGLSVDDVEIILTTTDKSKAFESNDPDNNYHLSNLKFHYASIYKEYDEKSGNSFVKNYTSKYGLSPSKYAMRGFDLTLDILLRLASTEDGLPNTNDTYATEYIENKFNYSKKMFGGFINQASYIVRHYNLKIVEVN